MSLLEDCRYRVVSTEGDHDAGRARLLITERNLLSAAAGRQSLEKEPSPSARVKGESDAQRDVPHLAAPGVRHFDAVTAMHAHFIGHQRIAVIQDGDPSRRLTVLIQQVLLDFLGVCLEGAGRDVMAALERVDPVFTAILQMLGGPQLQPLPSVGHTGMARGGLADPDHHPVVAHVAGGTVVDDLGPTCVVVRLFNECARLANCLVDIVERVLTKIVVVVLCGVVVIDPDGVAHDDSKKERSHTPKGRPSLG